MRKRDGDRLDTVARPAPAADKLGVPRARLPTGEPAATPAQQRDSLVQSIDELEGTLRFMGSTHPKRPSMEGRLADLRRLLEQLDQSGGR